MYESRANIDRSLVITSKVAPQYLIDMLVDIYADRPMPMYSVPGMMDMN